MPDRPPRELLDPQRRPGEETAGRLMRYEAAEVAETAEAWPPHDAAELDDEPASRWGCGWLTLLALIVTLAMIGGATWSVREIQRRNLTESLGMSFSNVSLLPSGRIGTSDPSMKLQIFYIARGQGLAAQARELTRPVEPVERIKMIANEMQRLPTSGLYEPALPAGTEVRGVFLNEGIVWVDLSQQFLAPPVRSPQLERLVVFAVVNNFMLNDLSLQGVRFMVEGQPIDSAWGWLDLSQPLGADISLLPQASGM